MWLVSSASEAARPPPGATSAHLGVGLGIPVGVDEDDAVGSREVNPDPAHPRGEEGREDARIRVEAVHQLGGAGGVQGIGLGLKRSTSWEEGREGWVTWERRQGKVEGGRRKRRGGRAKKKLTEEHGVKG